MLFRNYGREKKLLEKCLESLFSADPLSSNVVNGKKPFSQFVDAFLEY